MFLTIDLGTTSFKFGLFNSEGKLKALSIHEYKLNTPKPDFVEVEVETYLHTFKKGIKEISEKSKIDLRKLKVICFSSQGETFIPIDKNGKTLSKVMVWLDTRAKKETQQIANRFSQKEYYKNTGFYCFSPVLSGNKILWLKNNRRDVFNKTRKYLLLKDYFIWLLTGVFASDSTLLTSTGVFNLKKEKFWNEMLELIGLREEQFAKLYNPWDIVGKTTKRAKKLFNIPEGINVVVGSMDQSMSALGAGNFKEGILTANIGTCLSIYATTNKRILDPNYRMLSGNHTIPDKFFLLPFVQTAGMVLKWFRDNFSKEMDYNELVKLAESIKPGADGLIILPHLTGSSCPNSNPDAKGVFYGLTLQHNKAHMVRAILESIAYSMRENIEVLRGLKINTKEIIAIGGGAKSKLWLKIISDVTGKTILVPEQEESALLGGCILSCFALNNKVDIGSIVKKFCRIRYRINPDKNNKKAYNESYSKYLELYKTLF